MRFRQFLSDVGPTKAQEWNCEFCLERKLFKDRNCPLGITDGDAEYEKDSGAPQSDGAAARAKYGFNFASRPKRGSTPVANQEPEAIADDDSSKSRYVIRHGDFEFEECPVPMVSDGLMTEDDRQGLQIIDMVNWSEATGMMPVVGGLLDQANVFFEARKIVLSEQNKIDNEKQEERRAKMESERKSKGRGRKNV